MSDPTEVPSTLVVERVFPHPPERLWRALTESSLLAQWLMHNDFEPVNGRRFQFRAEPVPGWDGLIDCQVSVLEPCRQLSYTWVSMGLGFVVLWTLSPVEGGTHLRMEQSGFGAGQQKAYQGAKYGWQRFLGKLEDLIERMD